ncbi:MAG: GNAT family N-acetyltransferase [Candidatus Methanomethylicia archaeon]
MVIDMCVNFRRYVSGDEKGIVDLLKICFRSFNSWGLSVEDWLDYCEDDDGFKLENALVAENGGKIVGHIQLMHRKIRINKSILDCGGIANVSTHPDYRRQGIATKLLSMAIEICRGNGWPISSLFTGYGGEGYRVYRAMGYADTTFICEYIGTRERAEKTLKILPEEDVEIEEINMGNLGYVMKMYEECSRRINGSCYRSMDYWVKKIIEKTYHQSFFYEDKTAGIRIMVKKNGNIVGYALAFNGLKALRSRWLNKTGLILEIMAKNPLNRIMVFREILSRLLSEDVKLFVLRIPRNYLPKNVLKYFEEMKGAIYMDYITDQRRLFEELKPELEDRLKNFENEIETEICIRTPYGKTKMEIVGDEINFSDDENAENHIEFTRDGITKLIYGIKSFKELLKEDYIIEFKMNDYVLRMFNAMFPKKMFNISSIDDW